MNISRRDLIKLVGMGAGFASTCSYLTTTQRVLHDGVIYGKRVVYTQSQTIGALGTSSIDNVLKVYSGADSNSGLEKEFFEVDSSATIYRAVIQTIIGSPIEKVVIYSGDNKKETIEVREDALLGLVVSYTDPFERNYISELSDPRSVAQTQVARAKLKELVREYNLYIDRIVGEIKQPIQKQ